MNPKGTETKLSLVKASHSAARDRVLERIKNINWELEAIQTEMRLEHPQSTVARQFFGEDESAIAVLASFKNALDGLRRTVWSCLEDSSSIPAREQGHRLQRMTELMRRISPPPTVPAVTQSGSFFERLNLVIDNYIETRPLRGAPREGGKP
jgi:hypothetical protein